MFRKSGKPFFFLGLLSMAVSCLFSSCQKPRLVLPPSQSSAFGVYLTDSQENYEAVWINIQQVFIYVSNHTTDQSGWIEVPMTRQGLYNLLNFPNGADTLIAQSNVPPGMISQIRLMLGNHSSVTLNDGTTVPLQIPAALSNGIQLSFGDTLISGKPFDIDIDFNITSSISVSTSGNQYTFQPVITVLRKNSKLSIKGVLLAESRESDIR